MSARDAKGPVSMSPRSLKLMAVTFAALGIANLLRFARAATVDGGFRPDGDAWWLLVVGLAMTAGGIAFASMARRARSPG